MAQAQYHDLTRFEKNSVLRHFLILTQAPDWIESFAQQQWPVSVAAKTGTALAIDAQTLFLAYQGNWGVVPSGNLHLALSDDELTAEVRQLPLVVEISRRFAEHCQRLASTLDCGQYACSVEICFKTWRIDKELRLHGHLFAKKSFGGRMRCTNRASLLEFEGCKPYMTNYLLSRAAKGWAGAVQAQIQGSVFNVCIL